MIFDTWIHCSSHLISSSLDKLDAFKPRMKQHSLSAPVDKFDGPPSRSMARSIKCIMCARCVSWDVLNQKVETSCIPQRAFCNETIKFRSLIDGSSDAKHLQYVYSWASSFYMEHEQTIPARWSPLRQSDAFHCQSNRAHVSIARNWHRFSLVTISIARNETLSYCKIFYPAD